MKVREFEVLLKPVNARVLPAKVRVKAYSAEEALDVTLGAMPNKIRNRFLNAEAQDTCLRITADNVRIGGRTWAFRYYFKGELTEVKDFFY